ncbi:MAG TPA: FIST N-terminal domain-containing protein [Thermodesulfobacteriota bacterium]|nr:FIST N-terminal domain-containing protein [Thermodesulfobacteriota bacterium]
MQIEQLMWNTKSGWQRTLQTGKDGINPHLVLFFSGSNVLESDERYLELRDLYPDAHIVGCTSAGEIIDEDVYDESVVVSALEFKDTPLSVASVSIDAMEDSFRSGVQLGKELDHPELRGVLVISEGIRVNGSELVRGVISVTGDKVPVTGGLAGDGARFQITQVGCDSKPESGRIAAIGFYGSAITIGHGSVGGWDPFGPERHITRSRGNVLYELDSKPALELYKLYLGEEAANLPGSALLFPLMVRSANSKDTGVVRTVLSVNEEDQSMTFAGDIPQDYRAQLMLANFERLIDGAGAAAKIASEITNRNGTKLAILISCVGRKMILGQRTADEVEAVHEILGRDVAQIGFYSYGEISPHVSTGSCELHNQTMTITLLSEG